jgi:uncharacterized membrane protein
MRGEIAALAAAFLWALATVIFGKLGKYLSPLVLNLVKGSMAVLMLASTLLLLQQAPAGLNALTLGLLIASGVVGIGLGDTAYFAALNQLGPRRALLMETLAPPMAALLALIFLGETLSLASWLGIVLILLGVMGVISERVPQPAGIVPELSYRGDRPGELGGSGAGHWSCTVTGRFGRYHRRSPLEHLNSSGGRSGHHGRAAAVAEPADYPIQVAPVSQGAGWGSAGGIPGYVSGPLPAADFPQIC